MGRLALLEQVGPVAVLTLNRPERHNSLVPELLEEILAALRTTAANTDLRALLLQANGRSFSTGGDMRTFYERLADGTLETYAHRIVGLLNEAILALVELPMPAVAAVHGIVTGGSLGLVLGCDVVLVAPQASFTPYYSAVGFAPDGGWTALLPYLVGRKRAAQVLMSNEPITAEQAVAWGLACRAVPADLLDQEALAVAQQIASQKPGSLRHIKRLLALPLGDLRSRLEAERARFAEQIVTQEAREGIIAFLDRRNR